MAAPTPSRGDAFTALHIPFIHGPRCRASSSNISFSAATAKWRFQHYGVSPERRASLPTYPWHPVHREPDRDSLHPSSTHALAAPPRNPSARNHVFDATDAVSHELADAYPPWVPPGALSPTQFLSKDEPSGGAWIDDKEKSASADKGGEEGSSADNEEADTSEPLFLSTSGKEEPVLQSLTPSGLANCAVSPPFRLPETEDSCASISSERSGAGFHPSPPTSFGSTRLPTEHHATLKKPPWEFAEPPASAKSKTTAGLCHLGALSRRTLPAHQLANIGTDPPATTSAHSRN